MESFRRAVMTTDRRAFIQQAGRGLAVAGHAAGAGAKTGAAGFVPSLRRADFECGLLNDAKFFDVPLEVWLSDEYHASLATILKRSRPKAGVDLTEHVLLSSDPALRLAFGWGSANSTAIPRASGAQFQSPPGSCENTCVDAQ